MLNFIKEKEKWIDKILTVGRSANSDYPAQLKTAGFDTRTAMKKVYKIYEN